MDDTLRPKHHINPPAQCDSPKDAAAVSPPPQAQGKKDGADCEEEEDTEARGARLAGVAPGNGEGERRRRRDRRPLEREEHERKALERAKRLESREAGQT